MSDSPKPQRRTLLLLLTLFFLPLAAAFTLYYGMNWRPAGGSNHGELLKPMQQLPEVAQSLQGRWALVYLGEGECADACRNALFISRQAHLLLNKDMDRVNRVLLAGEGCCDRAFLDAEHSGITVLDVRAPAARDALRAVLPQGDLSNDLFVIDPMRNIVMRFDARENPKGLLADLKKLLKLSHIG